MCNNKSDVSHESQCDASGRFGCLVWHHRKVQEADERHLWVLHQHFGSGAVANFDTSETRLRCRLVLNVFILVLNMFILGINALRNANVMQISCYKFIAWRWPFEQRALVGIGIPTVASRKLG